MTVVSFTEFQKHRDRRQKRVLVLGDLTPHEDAREHHADGHGKGNVGETTYREGADASEAPEHDENQRKG